MPAAHELCWQREICTVLMQGSLSAMRTATPTYAAGVWVQGNNLILGAYPCSPFPLAKSLQVRAT